MSTTAREASLSETSLKEASLAVARRSQPERRAEAEQRLLLAACKIVARKGVVGMTLADVGELAGYSRGLAAHHFGNKAGLLRALAAHINGNFMAEIHAAPPRNPGFDSVLGFVSVYLSRTDSNWTNTRALILLMAEAMVENSETHTGLAEYNQTVIHYLATHLQTGIANGEVRTDLQPDISAVLIIGALRGVMLQHLLHGAHIDLPAVRDQLLDFMHHAVARDGQARQTVNAASARHAC